ncbi:MAG: radical SAM protein [Paludibacteraceae bacterium]|nr:radical SAM protein [Paludibacteraceae bacterium]
MSRAIRYRNLLKIGISWGLSLFHKRFTPMGKPYAASIEPANYCNLRCPQCPTGLRQIEKTAQWLSLSDFERYIEALLPELMWLNLYLQGEPLLNPKLPDMVAYATKRGVKVSVSTNGTLLTPALCLALKQAGLHELIVGIDGADASTYSTYRVGADFEQVVANTKEAVACGLNVKIQCLLLAGTVTQKQAVRQLTKQIGAGKPVFKRAQFYTDHLMPPDGRDSRYRHTENGTFVPKKRLRQSCWRLFGTAVISTNGDVLACCFDKWHRHCFGNLKHQSFDAIWQGQARRSFGQSVFGRRQDIGICNNCTE